MLCEKEKIRYLRQIGLHNWGEETQIKLKNMTAFVGGVGGSGSPILTQLALLGFGKIRVCDFDTVELSNLNRQFVHCVTEESKIGVNKAVSARATISNINPHVEVEVIQERIDDSNVDDIIGDADILFDSVDHIPSKFVLSASAIRKQIPHLFYGMMDINAFYVTFNPPHTPCFHCLYDKKKVAGAMLLSEKMGKSKRVTPVCCPALFLSTGFAVNEALKILLDIGKPAYNTFFLFLQKNNSAIAESKGFIGMKFWITDYFKQISKNQGYDWDQGWHDNIFEELDITRDPSCKYCSGL
jgi:adenylyltransferase/sulfurtransferase